MKIKIFTNLHRTTSPDAILYELGLHTQSFLTEEAGDVMSQTLRYFRSLQAHCLPDIETEPAVCSLEISLKFSIIPGEKKINLKFYLLQLYNVQYKKWVYFILLGHRLQQ